MTAHSHRFGDPAFQAFVLELRDAARLLHNEINRSADS